MIRWLLIFALFAASGTVPAAPQQSPKKPIPVRAFVPLPVKQRDFVPPETVGVPKDCPFPAVKKRVAFKCSCCGLRMWTHVLYPHLPHCPKDGCIMNEIEN